MFNKSNFGGGFGTTPASPSFGSTPNTTFGAAPTTTFGAAPPTTTFGAAPTTTFGPSTTPAFGSTQANSTFGAIPNSNPSTFGSTSNTTFGAASSTTQAFGSTPSTAFGAAPTTLAFGSTPNTAFGAAPTTTSAFGSTPSSTTFGAIPNSNQSTFGSTPIAAFGAAPSTTAPTFGFTPAATATTSTFGGPLGTSNLQTTNTNFGAFGQTQPTNAFGFNAQIGGVKNQSSNAFGFSAPALAPAPAPANFSLGMISQQPQQTQVIGEMFEGETELRQILFAYAPLVQINAKNELVPKDKKENTQSTELAFSTAQNNNYGDNEQCAFDAIMFDEKTQNTVDNSGRWPKHWEKNPDPDNLVQVKILGIEKLVGRKKEMEHKVQALKGEVKKMTQSANVSETELKKHINSIQQMKLKQAKLYNRLFSVLRKVEVLKLHKITIHKKELEFRDRLERIKVGISEPYTKIQMLLSKQAQEEQEHHIDNYASVENQSDIEKILIQLKYQREGLEHLSKILEKDINDIKIISEKMNSI